MSEDHIIQPPPFGSADQAETFIQNHELSTNNKYRVVQTRLFHRPDDVTSLMKINVKWAFNLASGVYCDGIPYIMIADQIRDCQYGFHKGNAANNDAETGERKRKGRLKKSVYCPAKIWTKTIMKFPEYKVDVYDGGVRRCDKKRIGQKLKREFDEDTQRFVMVFVQILNEHEHTEPETVTASNTIIEDVSREETPVDPTGEAPKVIPEKNPANIARRTSQGKTLGKPDRKRLKPLDDRPKGPVLKKGASLKGKNLMKLALDFKATEKLPFPLAQPKVKKRLESMTDLELISLYHDLTGEMPNEMFSISNKEFNLVNMCLLLHLCIIAANAEVDTDMDKCAHQSVRVKGTEHIFTPVICEDIACASIGEHMHCPLCSSCESYSDSSLLKKHFSVKHVQSSIEFAGLKILRCLDGCDVDSSDDFKVGHWHCCMCKSCHVTQKSCRKHFLAHLKSSEALFQVQVLQNVNPCVKAGIICHEINCVTAFNNFAMDISQDQYDSTADQSYNSGSISPMKKYLTSPETPSRRHHYVNVSNGDGHGLTHAEQQNSVMYIQDDNIASLLSLAQDGEVVYGYHEETDIGRLRSIIRELEQKCTSLDKSSMIQKSRIQFLTDKNEEQARTISELKMQYQDLLSQFEAVKKSDQTQTSDMNVDDDRDLSTSSTDADVKKFVIGKDGLVSKESFNNAPSKDKPELVKQCLDELKSMNDKQKQKLSKKTKGPEKSEANCIVEIKGHLDGIKKDIEQLKVAAIVNNQQQCISNSMRVGGINPLMYIGNNTSNVIPVNTSFLASNRTTTVKSATITKVATTSQPSVTKSAVSTPAKTVTPSISVVSVRPGASSDSKSSSSSSQTTSSSQNNSIGTQIVTFYPKTSIKKTEGQNSSPIKERSNPEKTASDRETKEAVSSIDNDDEDELQTENKVTVQKKNNTVIVALKPGLSSKFSNTEIEDLVNAAVQKMDDGKTSESSADPITEVENA